MNSKIKTSIYFVTAALLGAIALLAFSQVLLLVVGDIFAGALSGTPETGWGFLIVIFFYLPITAVTSSLAYWVGKQYKKTTQRSVWTIVCAAVVLAGAIFAGLAWQEKGSERPTSGRDLAVEKQLFAKFDQVNLYYHKEKSLPVAVPTDTSGDVTYSIVDESTRTYRICGEFELDTMPYYSEAPIAKKIKNQEAIKEIDAWGIYGIHQSGTQCYTIQLRALTQPQ